MSYVAGDRVKKTCPKTKTEAEDVHGRYVSAAVAKRVKARR